MLPFEMRIAGYMDSHRDNHVMYRVTPIYEGDNLVAKGVLLEAYSVEDEGEGVSFCVYAYNVQPGIRIFYDTGETEYTGEFLSEARLAGASTVKEAALTTEATTEVVIETTTDIYVSEETEEITELTVSNEMTYMLNMNTNKFHRISCSGINQMSDRNKWEYTGTRDEIIDMGYNPCKRCNP